MEKYLRHYAEPEIAALDGLSGREAWVNVLVIPACDETPAFLRPPPPCDGRSLMILVINESESALPEVSLKNRALAATVKARFVLHWHTGSQFDGFELGLYQDPHADRDILLVDRFSTGCKLPPKTGVGLARKIGADLAACLIHKQHILSPWIHCSDGDVHLPRTYFTCCSAYTRGEPKHAALIYPFAHCDDPKRSENHEVMMATQLYELSLRYYLAGMRFAGSPYAFHTIGSTMAVRASHYAKVRGFPKREAGEDFYILNKLAKSGRVLELEEGTDCKPIEIESRRSDRVPFGTGAAVNKITALDEPVAEFRYYHPEVFKLLKAWLHSLPQIWHSRSDVITSSIFSDQHASSELRGRGQLLVNCLKQIGTEKALGHAFRQSRDQDQFTRQVHTWFDAFRTLKLIHALRDQQLPSVSYARLEADRTFHQLLAQDADLASFHKYLNGKLQHFQSGTKPH